MLLLSLSFPIWCCLLRRKFIIANSSSSSFVCSISMLFFYLMCFIPSQIHHRRLFVFDVSFASIDIVSLFGVFHCIPNSSSSWSFHVHSQIMSILPFSNHVHFSVFESFSNHESSWVIYVVVIFYHSCSIANSITTAIHPISIRWLPFLVIVVHPIIDQILILAVTRISSISYLCFNPISVSHPKL